MSLSVLNASSKKAGFGGEMWWIIFNWKAINFPSLVSKKGSKSTLWMFSLVNP